MQRFGEQGDLPINSFHQNTPYMLTRILFFFLLFSLALTACREDLDSTGESIAVPEPPITRLVEGDVLGRVINEAGNPLGNVQIALGSDFAITDDRGFFIIENVEMNAAGTVVTAQKSGYFDGSRRFFPDQGNTSHVSITLMEASLSGSFEAPVGGVVPIPGGAELQFSAQSITTASGMPFDGRVEVAARWLDPTAENLSQIMPGNLQALDNTGAEVALGSFGMMAVELSSPSGAPLQIASGSSATLSFPIPQQLQADAPDEIPLWSFDESVGLWIEEGTATRSGNAYIGEVSHFSFWNCDIPFPLIELTGSVQDDQGTGIPWLTVRITAPDFGGPSVGYGWTDASGNFSGKVPEGSSLLIEVLGQCGLVASGTYGPYSDDTDIGVLIADPANVFVANSLGDLVDCDGNPIANGLVVAEYDNTSSAFQVQDGIIDGAIITCEPTTPITFTGFDLSSGSQSDAITLPYAQNLDLGTLEACDGITGEFLSIFVEGYDPIFFPEPLPFAYQDSIISGPSGPFGPPALGTVISAYIDSLYFVTMHIDGLDAGVYPASDNQFFNFGDISQGLFTTCTQCFETELTAYGEVGEYIEGTFSGTMPFETNNGMVVLLPTEGAFRIIREN